MSVVTFNKVERQYFYSFKSSTQSEDMSLLISQSDKGLAISVTDKKGLTIPVEGHLIRGLPKMSPIPRAFFENAYSVVQKNSNNSFSICFSNRGLGGWEPYQLQFTLDGNVYIFDKINRSGIRDLKQDKGLYVFINPASAVGTYSYIGESSNLGSRLNGHEKLAANDYIYVHVLHGNTSDSTRKRIEAEMIRNRNTIRNIQHN